MPRTSAVSVPRPSPVPLRDRTDPRQGPRVVQLVLDAAVEALANTCGGRVMVQRSGHPAALHASVDRLRLKADDVLLVLPRTEYRAPSRPGGAALPRHLAELRRLSRGRPLGLRELGHMIAAAARAAAPGFTLSAIPAAVPLVQEGRQVDVRLRGSWRTIGHAGLLADAPGADAGPGAVSGLLLTLDLDALAMLAKGIDDPALLHSEDPQVAAQMMDLEPYVPPEAWEPRAERRRPARARFTERGRSPRAGSPYATRSP